MQYLSIDYGKKRIGIAVGSVFPRGLKFLRNIGVEESAGEIAKIAELNNVDNIVVGMPYRSQGEEGTIAKEIREFASLLADQANLPIFFEPEQFTSSEAERYFKEMGIRETEGKTDELAAILILEQFLRDDSDRIPDIKPKEKGLL